MYTTVVDFSLKTRTQVTFMEITMITISLITENSAGNGVQGTVAFESFRPDTVNQKGDRQGTPNLYRYMRYIVTCDIAYRSNTDNVFVAFLSLITRMIAATRSCLIKLCVTVCMLGS